MEIQFRGIKGSCREIFLAYAAKVFGFGKADEQSNQFLSKEQKCASDVGRLLVVRPLFLHCLRRRPRVCRRRTHFRLSKDGEGICQVFGADDELLRLPVDSFRLPKIALFSPAPDDGLIVAVAEVEIN